MPSAGQCARDLGAQALDADGRCVAGLRRARFAAPGLHGQRGLAGEGFVGAVVAHQRRQRLDRQARVTHHRQGVGIHAARFGRVGIDLHHGLVRARDAPRVRVLVAQLRADHQHQVGLVHEAVGDRHAVAAHAADGQRVHRRQDGACAHRGGHRRAERTGQRQDGRAGTGRERVAARDDDDLARAADRHGRGLELVSRGREHRARDGLEQVGRHVRVVQQRRLQRLGHEPGHVQVHRPRHARQRRAPGIGQQAGQVGSARDVARVAGDGGERLPVVDLLVGVAVLVGVRLAAGDRDQGRAGQPRVLQAGGQVGGADRLRPAQPGLAGHAGIAVGHVRGGLLGVRQDGLHAAAAQLVEGVPQDRLEEEDVAGAGVGDLFGHPGGGLLSLRCGHACHSSWSITRA
jgi:hypothetical protein